MMCITAAFTTILLIIVSETMGKRTAKSVSKMLEIAGIVPIAAVLIKLFFIVPTATPEEVNAAGIKSTNEIMSYMPEAIISAFVGYIVGVVLWGLYKTIKPLFK